VDCRLEQKPFFTCLDRMKKWADWNLTEFNRTKCKVLHLGWNNPMHHCRLGANCVGSSSAQKDAGVWWTQAEHEPAL